MQESYKKSNARKLKRTSKLPINSESKSYKIKCIMNKVPSVLTICPQHLLEPAWQHLLELVEKQ
jgi:hypothetical protein